jgi:hypothetical protein
MTGMFHTAAAHAQGMRTLRARVPDASLARGTEWVSLPLLQLR